MKLEESNISNIFLGSLKYCTYLYDLIEIYEDRNNTGTKSMVY